MTKVRYSHLSPTEFRSRLAQKPLAYLPLGTLEWHGEHLPLGTDSLISEHLMIESARQFGGIVLPPIFLGPDRAQIEDDGSLLYGMDFDATTIPVRPLDGSCYWVPDAFFRQMMEMILAQLTRVGFRAVFADGHGPSRKIWISNIENWADRFNMILLGVTEEVESKWRSQIDHAARNETSQILAINPSLASLDKLPKDGRIWPQGVSGEDPRKASIQYGQDCYKETLQIMRELLNSAGI